MDVGLLMIPGPRRMEAVARMVEDLGFASLIIPDSQNLAPEVWGQLMLAARATSRIRLGPGVTNSVTRDPAVTASAALPLFLALAALGLDFVHVIAGSTGMAPELGVGTVSSLARDIVPALRA